VSAISIRPGSLREIQKSGVAHVLHNAAARGDVAAFVGGVVKKLSFAQLAVLATVVLLHAHGASAQSAPQDLFAQSAPQGLFAPSAAQGLSTQSEYLASPRAQATFNQQQPNVPGQAAVASAVKKWRIGVDGGVGLDPEIIIFGVHGYLGPLFKSNVNFRPGFELGFGELTTMIAFDLDVVFTVRDENAPVTTWTPYFGLGPNFALSHKGFSAESGGTSTTTTTNGSSTTTSTTSGRFDFGDTTFDTGLNFIVGMRKTNGLFAEMKATAYGVSSIRLMIGYDF
jgi:hypothetical protein